MIKQYNICQNRSEKQLYPWNNVFGCTMHEINLENSQMVKK